MVIINKDDNTTTLENATSGFFLIYMLETNGPSHVWTGIDFELMDEDELGFTPIYVVNHKVASKQYAQAHNAATKNSVFSNGDTLKIIPISF